MAPGYTGISVTPAARDALRKFQAVAGGHLAHRVTLTDALMLAVKIAQDHLDTDATAAAAALNLTENGETE